MRWALAGQQNGGITMKELITAAGAISVAIIGGVFMLLKQRIEASADRIMKRNTDEHQVTAETAAATQRLVTNSVSTLVAGVAKIVDRLDTQDALAEDRHVKWLADRVEIFERLDQRGLERPITQELPITPKETE
jgi:hypothetical protein